MGFSWEENVHNGLASGKKRAIQILNLDLDQYQTNGQSSKKFLC